jgi:hypothetical protein
MKQSIPFLTVQLIVAMATTHAAFPQTAGKLEAFGLQGKRVSALALAQHVGPPSSLLYAVTENEGVYRRSLDPPDTTWQDLGLKSKNLTALDIQVWGVGPSVFHAPVVGALPDRSAGDSTLIYRLEGEKWIPADSGIARDEVYWIKALESIESAGHAPPGDALAGGSGVIYRSQTFSRQWKEAYNGGIGATNAIATSGMVFMSGTVWAGGETGVFAPWIAKSNDGGETWEVSYPDLKGDNACNSLAIHTMSSNIVYAGMEGAVVKTTDAGKTWDYTSLRNTPVYFYGLALAPEDLDHIYAGGLIANPNSWALWESFDAGLNWKEIPPPVLITPVVVSGITSIVADRYSTNVIYLATLGHGVWKYTSQITRVEDRPGWVAPENFTLLQNYPNPFNPETLIRYRLSSPQQVRLEVYNLQGRLIATLINQMQTPGEHSVRWNARETAGELAPSGIYLYRLRVGTKHIATRKMILLW